METLGNRLWDSLTGQGRPGTDGVAATNAGVGAGNGSDDVRGANKDSDLFNTFLTKAIDMGHSATENFGMIGDDTKVGKVDKTGKANIKSKGKSFDADASTKEASNASSNPSSTYVDMFVERILSMAIPTTTTSSKRELNRILGRIEMQRSRPSLSMQIMSKNSILLLQRLSVPFETIDFIINIINWKSPIKTITTMIFLSLCILKPINFLTIPLFYICFEIIIPAYMVQNPNIDDSVEGWENELPKPVNQISREFLLNVTDLQNHMLLYVDSWDMIISWCWRLFYFKDELLTWSIFAALLSVGIFIELFGTSILVMLFPFVKLMLVVMTCLTFIALHPTNREKIMRHFHSEQLRLQTVTWVNYYESKLLKDLDLNNADLEIRQMEIFELQSFNEETKTWQFVCFSQDIYPPNSHLRRNNIPIEGTLTLDAISPPSGWKFVNPNMSHASGRPSTRDTLAEMDKTEESGKRQHKRMIFDHEKNKMLKSKRKHEKALKKRQLKQQKAKTRNVSNSNNSLSPNKTMDNLTGIDSKKEKIKRRRASNDFNNILLDPLTLKKNIVEKMETGITYEGWHMDMCPKEWVSQSYLGDVVDVDDDTKWVYDFMVMGNGAVAYSSGGLGLSASAKLRKQRGDVRRRRWVRYAVREIIQSVVQDDQGEKLLGSERRSSKEAEMIEDDGSDLESDSESESEGDSFGSYSDIDESGTDTDGASPGDGEANTDSESMEVRVLASI